jgi:hypothetical protein
MKGNLIEFMSTLRKEAPQMREYNDTAEPKDQIELVQKEWELLKNCKEELQR